MCDTIYLTIKLNVKYIEREVPYGTAKDHESPVGSCPAGDIRLIERGRKSAGEIAGRFDITDAAISRHLSVLKEADLIRDTREGKYIYYDLNASVLEEILWWISDLKGDNSNA